MLRFAGEWDTKALRETPVFLAWAPKIGKKHRGRGLSGKTMGLVLAILYLMYLHEVHITIKYGSGDVCESCLWRLAGASCKDRGGWK